MAESRAAEGQRLVLQWQKSDPSAWRFAEEHGVAPRTLVWWRWRLRREQETKQHEDGKVISTMALARDSTRFGGFGRPEAAVYVFVPTLS